MNKLVRVETRFMETGRHHSDRIDCEQLERDMVVAIEALNGEGYEVVSVMPVTSGYSYGEMSYGYTDAVMIVGRRV